MRALSLRAPRDAHVVDTPIPEPASGEVLVRITACGVCGSDLNAWRGVPGIEYPLPAGAPGHEVVGEVVALGADVSVPAVSTRVTGLLWNGFAEFGLTRADYLVAVPRHIEDFPGEPLACAANIVRRAAISAGDAVAFVGFGYLGALIAHFLPPSIGPWIAIARRGSSRELAMTLGAQAAYDFADVPSDAWDHYPVVVETAGVQQALDYATWLTAYGGRLVVAGYHADGPRTVNMQSWNWKGIDVVNAHERRPDVYVQALQSAYAQLSARADLATLRMLHTHCFALRDIAQAFTSAEQRPAGFVKALVRP